MKKLLVVVMVCVAVTAAQAVIVDNFSFEQPGTEKIKGWNGEGVGGTPAEDIPGWASDAVVADSGIESDWPGSTEGSWSAFIKSGDPSAYNTTSHVIAAGEIYLLEVDARNNWTESGNSDLQLSLYYDVAGVRNLMDSAIVTLTDNWATFSLTVSADDIAGAAGAGRTAAASQKVSPSTAKIYRRFSGCPFRGTALHEPIK